MDENNELILKQKESFDNSSTQSSNILNINLITCLLYSDKLKNILALFDTECMNGSDSFSKICTACDVSTTDFHIYEQKGKQEKNFLLILFENQAKQNKLKTFESLIDFLNQFKSTRFIRDSIINELDVIQNEVMEKLEFIKNHSIQVSITDHRNGCKIELVNMIDKSLSKCTIGTNSSNESNQIQETYFINAYLVYFDDQLKNNEDRIKNFRRQAERVHIKLIDLDLSKKSYEELRIDFEKPIPLLLLLDNKLKYLLEMPTSRKLDRKILNIKKFYMEIYMEYLKNSSNKRCYLFLLDKIVDSTENEDNKELLKFKWMLRVKTVNDTKYYQMPLEIPSYEKNKIDNSIEKFLKSIRKEFCYSFD